MTLDAYVQARYGDGLVTKLANIRRGGDNNAKGSAFETYYAAAKVCEIAATQPDNLDNFLVSCQERAFVDDLCVRQVAESHKENFQAKNSSGSAAEWDADMEDRFRMQMDIDTNFHAAKSNRQILLVSCADMQAANDAKIPEDLKENCFSEFFPYDPYSTKVIYASEALRTHLKAIVKDPNDLQAVDTAFRVVIAALVSSDRQRSVGDLLGLAKGMSKPDLFRDDLPERTGVPGWLHELCMAFPELEARVEFGNFKVGYNGFEVDLGANPDQPEPEVRAGLKTVGEVFSFLMLQVHKELQ